MNNILLMTGRHPISLHERNITTLLNKRKGVREGYHHESTRVA